MTLIGTLVSVDCKAGTLMLKAGGKKLGMNAVTKAAKEALRKLKAGDRVRVSYTETEEEHLHEKKIFGVSVVIVFLLLWEFMGGALSVYNPIPFLQINPMLR